MECKVQTEGDLKHPQAMLADIAGFHVAHRGKECPIRCKILRRSVLGLH